MLRMFTKNLLLFAVLTGVVIFFARIFPAMQKGLDFADFYVAARIVHDGRGAELYDPRVQNEYLARYSGRVGTYFIHPPFESLLYLPFALLPLSRAYTLWSAFQAIQLIAVGKLLEASPRRWSWRFLVPASLLFTPLLLDFLQGQDSLFLLLLLTSALLALQRKRDFTAGCLLACGLFRFHIVIPAALPILFIARKGLAWGFASVAAVLFCVSVGISGWGVIVAYPRFLLHLGSLPLAGIHNSQKANLCGLFDLAFGPSERMVLALTLLSSVLVLGLSLRYSVLAMKSASNAGLVLVIAILAAMLVSYHLSPHDLTILILPMVLLVDHLLSHAEMSRAVRFGLILTLIVLFLPPLHLLLLREHRYAFAGFPILVLFGITLAYFWRDSIRKQVASC
jgi:alpha-1,2-mannosyltransferase